MNVAAGVGASFYEDSVKIGWIAVYYALGSCIIEMCQHPTVSDNMNNLVKKLVLAATTATTACMATTVLPSPAAAAIFTPSTNFFEEVWTIEYGDDNATTLVLDPEQWTGVKYGVEQLFKETAANGEYQWVSDDRELEVTVGVYSGLEELDVRVWGGIRQFFGIVDFEYYRAADFVLTDVPPPPPVPAEPVGVPEPSGAIALSLLGLGLVASRLRRRSGKDSISQN